MNRIFTANLLFDGNDVIEDGALIIDGDRVVASGPRSTLSVGDRVTRHFDGGFIMPGLVDAHNHLGLVMDGRDDEDQFADPPEEITKRAKGSALADLSCGITTLRELGEPDYLDIEFRRQIESGAFPGPRLITSGPWITPTHGHGAYPVGADIADGVDEVRKAIRRHIRAGVEAVKIMISGGIADRGRLDVNYYSGEEICAAINEAHNLGIRVAAHCYGGPGVRLAVEAGIDSLEHAARITNPVDVALIAAHGTFVVFTSGVIYEDSRVAETIAQAFQTLYQAGANIALGADCLHGEFSLEVELAVRYGATPLDALRMATVRGAAVCGVGDKVGALRPGMLADFVVLAGNPAMNVTDLRKVQAVVKGGEFAVDNG